MTPLPIDPFLPQIVSALRERRSLVLVAEPGAGKTTRVPPAILAAGLLSADHPNLVMLQPRRVAARAAAARIAYENGWTVGKEVGHHVRFDKKVGPRTRLRVLTEGILTRQLLGDPFLEGVGCVILDEFHERSLDVDLAVALLNEVRAAGREDLLIVVMSATLEAEPVAAFLGGAPVMSVPGRTFPVEIEYRPPAPNARVEESVATAVAALRGTGVPPGFSSMAERRESGRDARATENVLIFLPGVGEIERAMRALAPLAERENLDVLPLHGSLTPAGQMRALAPSRRRKIVCATNIAETSLTIDGVTTVIDAGLARVPHFDPDRGLDRLDLVPISRASAEQRAGRAGRTAAGRCVRLWSAREQHARPAFESPEVMRVDLCATVLTLAAWGQTDPRRFGWFQPPPEASLAAAEDLLRMLGAVGPDGRLTPLGKQLQKLPVHPRLGRLLLAAGEAGLAGEGAALAALLAERDLIPPNRSIRSPTASGASDLLLRLDALNRAERAGFAGYLRDEGIDPTAARQVAQARDELLRTNRGTGVPPASVPSTMDSQSAERGRDARATIGDAAILKLPLLAYPDRVCRRRANDPTRAAMVGGAGVRLSAESVVTSADLFLALDARHDPFSRQREAAVRVAHAVEVEWLQELFPEAVRTASGWEYDPARERVIGVRRTLYRDLVLREDLGTGGDPAEASAVLAEALRPRAFELIQSDEAASALLNRVAFLRGQMPERDFPLFDSSELEMILYEAASGGKSLDDVRKRLADAVRGRLIYPLDRLLDEHAPESVAVPTGNRIKLAYAPDGSPPTLAVRVQELFGLAATPRVAAGRVAVKLELLGPNYRPVQLTDDLASFWANTYPQVRKDLRARYPKHSWPEDPTAAEPTARGGRRR